MDLDLVVELRVVHDGENRTASAGFGVGGGVDEARDASVDDGSGAHCAGLERDVECAIFDAVVSEMPACFAESDDLCVCCGIVVAEDAVLAVPYDFSLMDDNCAHRDFAGSFGGLRFGDGGA